MDHSVCNMKAILAVAVLAMAAFTGIMIVGDDADAADPVTITFMVGGESSTRTMTGVTFVAPSPADIGFDIGDKIFENWAAGDTLEAATASGAVYRAGMEYAVPSASMKLWAIFDDNIYVTLVVGDESFKCPVKYIEAQAAVEAQGTAGQPDYVPARDATPEKYIIDIASEQYKAAETAVKAIDLNKFRLNGWFVKDATSAKYTDLAEIVAATDLDESITLTLKTTAYFQISFVVEDVNITTLASDKLADETGKYIIPVAPTKENHVFTAWIDKDGKDVITYTVDGGYKPVASELKFTEDTVLYAAFTPDNMTVTFVVGEFSTTQTVLYGALAMKPELPAGYVAWVDDKGEEFNFNTPIKANITLTAKEGEPVTIYTVTFEIDGKAPVTQRSDSMVLPDTKIEGKVFQGWVVKGESQYVSPMSYDITEDITFVAVYKEADPPAGPGFFETTTGQCVAVIIAVVIIALIYAVATNMFGLKDALTSVKITRVKK